MINWEKIFVKPDKGLIILLYKVQHNKTNKKTLIKNIISKLGISGFQSSM